jgi:Fur family ferric uptake transcriptional regulator
VPAPSDPTDTLRDLLRAAGLRSTAPRICVLRLLSAAKVPMTHKDAAEALASQGIDRATVYRVLMDLSEVGLLMRTDHGDHVWRFERKRDHQKPEAHPHFLCSDCGEVSCLPDVRIEAPFGAPHALETRAVEIQIKGRCDRCI